MRGIYKVEGDTLTLVVRVCNDSRPVSFDEKTAVMKMVLTRVKN